MNTESFLLFFFKHNAVLIESLVVAILLAAAILTYRSFKISKEEESNKGASPDLAHLEGMLQKILEKSNSMPGGAAGAATSPAPKNNHPPIDAAALTEQINILKKELEVRQQEITAIKASPSAGAAAQPNELTNEEKASLEAQIKELQKKLEEFDIISADIADLSFYKEENLRLQKELANIKGAAPSTPAPVAVAPPPPQPAPAAPPPKPEPEPAPVAKVVETPAAAPAPPPPPPPVEVKAAEPVVEAPAAPAPVVEEKAEATAVQEVVDEDLIKEYAAMVDAQRSSLDELDSIPKAQSESKSEGETAASPSETESIVSNFDIEKMAAEATKLPEVDENSKVNILTETLDPEKLAEEANNMNADQQAKEIMGQFEDFSKKEK